MQFLFDLHMHTNLTDGKNTPEEMVKKAIEKGLKTVGISEHAYIPFDRESMSREKTLFFREEMKRLKEKYKGVIEVLCGAEMDYFSEDDPAAYDYVIGSVHYVKVKGEYYGVDYSPEDTEKAIRNAFGGDALSYATAYYELLSEVKEKTDADIIGHFDLITKFDEKSRPIAKDGGEAYNALAVSALDEILKGRQVFFEINTGAMSRSWRSSPYPASGILSAMKERGARVLLSGDAHFEDGISYAFDEAYARALSCGYEAFGFEDKAGIKRSQI